jgi:chorismate mutase
MSDAKPYNSPALDAVRQQIDELDNKIHDTLMERTELIRKIIEEKKKKNIPVVQPAREARMIRRLLERHEGALPEMAVVRIWRELVGAVSMLQTGLKVAVVSEQGHPIWDMARDYFGSCLPMVHVGSPLSAVSALREDKVNLAVLPWPQEDEDKPWWTFLEADKPEQAMQIIVRLPHGDDPADKGVDNRALVIAKSGFDDSGDDHSFLLIECSADVSRARLVDKAKSAGIEAISIVSNRTQGPYQPAMHLMEVKGYFAGNDDGKCQAFARSLSEEHEARVVCIGGYPVPPVYSKTVRPTLHDIPSAPREEAAE